MNGFLLLLGLWLFAKTLLKLYDPEATAKQLAREAKEAERAQQHTVRRLARKRAAAAEEEAACRARVAHMQAYAKIGGIRYWVAAWLPKV